MRFALDSGIQRCTASLAGKQINPNSTSAANGRISQAMASVVMASILPLSGCAGHVPEWARLQCVDHEMRPCK